MTKSNLQTSHPSYIENRVVRQVASTTLHQRDEEDASLLLNVFRRRWKMLIACFIASAATAAYCFVNFSLPKSETEAKVLYRPLPPSGVRGNLEETLEPLTIGEMFVSNDCLNELAELYNVPVTAKIFRDYFDIEASRYVKLISIRFNWHDGQEGIDMVNDLIKIVTRRIVNERREVFANYRKHQNQQLREIETKLDVAQKRLNQLTEQNESLIAKDGLELANNNMLHQMIVSARSKLNDASMKSATLDKQISDVRALIAAKEERIRAEAIKGKQAQYESRKALYRQSSPKMVELGKRIKEFEVDNAGLDYPAWKSKLDALGASPSNNLLATFPNPNAASVDQMEKELLLLRGKLSELEIDAAPLNEQIVLLHNRVDEYQRDYAESVGDSQVNSSQIDEATTNLNRLREQKAEYEKQKMAFQHLEETDFREIKVHTPASWDTTEVFNGKKKLFVFVFAGAFAVLAIPVFLLEHFFPSNIPAETASKECELPIVGRDIFVKDLQNQRDDHVNSESLRLLALRIQQSVQSPGGTVVFSGLNHDESAIPTLTYLAECLSRREERVLIIDAWNINGKKGRKDNPSQALKIAKNPSKKSELMQVDGQQNSDLVSQETNPVSLGLSEFFNRTDLKPQDLVCSTDIPGVDIIPSGSTGFPEEAFGLRKLNDLFDACRAEYTMILIAGPSTNHPSDLHMLSARADGLLFTAPAIARRKTQGEVVVNELRDLGAPIIGIVS